MSKSYKRKYEEDYDEYDEYGDLKKKVVDRRKKRRFDRALKVKNIDEILDYADEEDWDELR